MAPIALEKSKALTVAEYFIKKSQSENRVITNKKLQKLLYYAQAWSLVFNHKKIFEDRIEAWVHGPAIPTIYSEFKDFGYGNIETSINEKDLEGLAGDELKILDEVWKAYGKFDADYLEVLTHNEAPWQKAREGLASDMSSTNEISTDFMKEYYERRLKESA